MELISALVVFLPRSSIRCMCVHIQHIISSVCTHFFFCIIGHHIPCQGKSAEYYLVYLDIWLLLFRSAPTQILLIALTNTASPVCYKSKQDTVVAPSVGSNLNVSAGVNPGTENQNMPSVCVVCCIANCQILFCPAYDIV